MSPYICKNCKELYIESINGKCPSCGEKVDDEYDFSNSDKFLHDELINVKNLRKELELEGLVGGLDSVIINTEPDHMQAAVLELENFTSLKFQYAFEDEQYSSVVLQTPNSANYLLRSRKMHVNPFASYNANPKSQHLPNTRLESFVFQVSDIEKYFSIQKNRNVEFLTDQVLHNDSYSFIQTQPSKYLGISFGFIQWHQPKPDYHPNEFQEVSWTMEHPHFEHQKNIYHLDHTASRVKARDRDAAIKEFMELTNYNFDFAIYVKNFNSITSVARLSEKDFAMVFTSGINPFVTYDNAGPTERYIYNYGPRTHHMAFQTEKIEDTFASLQENGMDFLIDLVGSEDDGLKQTFSVQSPNTLLVNEYIHRYGDFDGFFTKSNVRDLTHATDKQ